MKIAIINHFQIEYGGGAERWIEAVKQQLSGGKSEIDIIAPRDLKFSPKVYEITYKSGLYNFLKRIRLYNLLYIFVYPKKNIKLNSYDIIYTTSFYHYLLYLRVQNKIIIGTHDLFLDNNRISIDTLMFPFVWLFRILCKKDNIYLHSLTNLHTNKFKLSNTKCYELGNNFMIGKNLPSYNNKEFTITFIGSLVRRKGANLLIEIAQRISLFDNIMFNIIGSGEKKYLNYFHNIKSNKIRYLGHVSDKEKFRVLGESHLLLLLSARESFSLVAAEGLSFGLPVLTTWAPLAKFQKGEIYTCQNEISVILEKILDLKNRWKKDTFLFYQEMYNRAVVFQEQNLGDKDKLLAMFQTS
jgi:glycosyltransferase involved in cell wall biosynthesis